MNQEQILEALRSHGAMTPRQIQALFKDSPDQDSIDHIRRKLRALHKYELVKPVGKVKVMEGAPPAVLWEAVW